MSEGTRSRHARPQGDHPARTTETRKDGDAGRAPPRGAWLFTAGGRRPRLRSARKAMSAPQGWPILCMRKGSKPAGRDHKLGSREPGPQEADASVQDLWARSCYFCSRCGCCWGLGGDQGSIVLHAFLNSKNQWLKRSKINLCRVRTNDLLSKDDFAIGRVVPMWFLLVKRLAVNLFSKPNGGKQFFDIMLGRWRSFGNFHKIRNI